MRTFRITYRREVYIEAENEEEAQNIYDNMDEHTLHKQSEYVEQVSIDED